MNESQFTQAFGRLTPKPKKVLEYLLKGKNDEEIAQAIKATTGTVRKHIQNTCNLFEIGSEIGGIKKNRREELVRLFSFYKPDLVSNQFSGITAVPMQVNSPPEANHRSRDWADAPDTSVGFYGRETELERIENWIIKENCRLVSILGMPGIGKTSLLAKLGKNIQGNFDYVIWRTLRKGLCLRELITDLLKFFPAPPKAESFERLRTDHLISILIDYLTKFRCLLLFDRWGAILSEKKLAGHYQDKNYLKLIKRLAQEKHKSCLVLTSRERPREIALFEAGSSPTRSWQLQGLSPEAASKILEEKELKGKHAWGKLIELYRGNPFALKIVASPIHELFMGDVTEFLKMSLTGVLLSFQGLVEKELDRLSSLEILILYWLAILQQEVSLVELGDLLPRSETNLISPALMSLRWRSLVEQKAPGKFTLQPILRECVTNRLVQEICQEIQQYENTKQLSLLRTYELDKSPDPGEVKEGRHRPIVSLINNRLLAENGLIVSNKIMTMLKEILADVEKAPQKFGHGQTNLKNLLDNLQNS